MGAIANIARQRPDYMSRVVQTFEALQGKARSVSRRFRETFSLSSEFTSDISRLSSQQRAKDHQIETAQSSQTSRLVRFPTPNHHSVDRSRCDTS